MKPELPEVQEYVRFPSTFLGKEYAGLNRLYERVFWMNAAGNGMSEAGILDGDRLLFDTALKPSDGDIVCVAIDGVQMCRRLFHKNEVAYIRREDGISPDVVIDENCIQGVLIGIWSQRRFASPNYNPDVR